LNLLNIKSFKTLKTYSLLSSCIVSRHI